MGSTSWRGLPEESVDLELDVVDVGDSGSEVTSPGSSDGGRGGRLADRRSNSQVCADRFPGGDDSGGAACRLTAPPTAATEASQPPEIYGPVRPAQPTFVSPQLPEVWQLVKVVDRSDTTCPGVPPPSMTAWRPICFRGWLGGG